MNEDDTKKMMDGDKLDLILKEIQNLNHKVTSIDAHVHSLDQRVAALEAKSYDTRPIWERALAEILEVKAELAEVKKDQISLKTDVQEIKQQQVALHREMKQLTRQQNILNNEFLAVKGDWSELEDRLIILEQQAERPSA